MLDGNVHMGVISVYLWCQNAKKGGVFRNYVHIAGQRSSTVNHNIKVGLEKYCGDVSLKLGVCLASFLVFKQLQPGCLVLVC